MALHGWALFCLVVSPLWATHHHHHPSPAACVWSPPFPGPSLTLPPEVPCPEAGPIPRWLSRAGVIPPGNGRPVKAGTCPDSMPASPARARVASLVLWPRKRPGPPGDLGGAQAWPQGKQNPVSPRQSDVAWTTRGRAKKLLVLPAPAGADPRACPTMRSGRSAGSRDACAAGGAAQGSSARRRQGAPRPHRAGRGRGQGRRRGRTLADRAGVVGPAALGSKAVSAKASGQQRGRRSGRRARGRRGAGAWGRARAARAVIQSRGPRDSRLSAERRRGRKGGRRLLRAAGQQAAGERRPGPPGITRRLGPQPEPQRGRNVGSGTQVPATASAAVVREAAA